MIFTFGSLPEAKTALGAWICKPLWFEELFPLFATTAFLALAPTVLLTLPWQMAEGQHPWLH